MSLKGIIELSGYLFVVGVCEGDIFVLLWEFFKDVLFLGGVINVDVKGELFGLDGVVEGMDLVGEFCLLVVLEDVGEGCFLVKWSKEEFFRESFLIYIFWWEDSIVFNFEWFLYGWFNWYFVVLFGIFLW